MCGLLVQFTFSQMAKERAVFFFGGDNLPENTVFRKLPPMCSVLWQTDGNQQQCVTIRKKKN